DLLPEGGQQLSEGVVMDVAEVDEKIGRWHRVQVRSGSRISEDVRSSRKVALAQTTHALRRRVADLVDQRARHPVIVEGLRNDLSQPRRIPARQSRLGREIDQFVLLQR